MTKHLDPTTMTTQQITRTEKEELKEAAMSSFPTINKMYPNKAQIVTNRINNRLMYLMPVILENGGRGYPITFSMYVDKEIR